MSEPHDDPTLLASAYLDDEATPDERALVETSQETLDEVERLGRVRTVLAATVEPVSLAAREAHLAAALDVWERMATADGSGETPSVDAAAAAALSTPRSGRDGRRSQRSGWATSPWFLGAAASLVLVAGVGAVLLGGRGVGEDQDATGVPNTAAADALDSADQLSRASDQATEGFETETLGAEVAPAGTTTADESLLEPASADDGDLDVAIDNEAPAAVFTVPADGPPAETDLTLLTSRDDLADFASAAREVADVDRTEAPNPASCEAKLGIELVIDVAIYNGTPVTVGIDLGDEVAIAYADDCAEVARTALDR